MPKKIATSFHRRKSKAPKKRKNRASKQATYTSTSRSKRSGKSNLRSGRLNQEVSAITSKTYLMADPNGLHCQSDDCVLPLVGSIIGDETLGSELMLRTLRVWRPRDRSYDLCAASTPLEQIRNFVNQRAWVRGGKFSYCTRLLRY